MLQFPTGEEPLRIVSFDPGTNTFGAAILEIDLVNRQLALAEAHLFKGVELMRNYPRTVMHQGERFARVIAQEENLVGFLRYAQPHVVVTEAPYMGRFPQAFSALTEIMLAIRRATWRYDAILPLNIIDPSSVKKFMGVKGTSKDKSAMTRALMAKTDLLNPSGIDLEALDEHRIDAICVGCYQAGTILSQM
jgi:hypothetical protein